MSGLAGAQSKFDVSVSGVNFASDESNSYLSYALRYAVTPTLDAAFRGTDGKRQTLARVAFSINHGGDDRELFFAYRPTAWPKFDIGVGAAVPNTPERNNPLVGTFDAGWTESCRTDNSVRFGVKGIAARNPIAALTSRGTFALPNSSIDLIGDIAVPFTGNNTRSTSDGTAQRAILVGVGLQIGARNRDAGWHASVRLTNELGETTGMSLTPSLGSRYGFVVSVGVRF
ncbi:MAG TPA: hypothetical protein VKT78_00755 [Fimbriimonadaceae bacterium]|nr:hypothetical protein [Fimbriimonadaceae bacterium]